MQLKADIKEGLK